MLHDSSAVCLNPPPSQAIVTLIVTDSVSQVIIQSPSVMLV